MAKFIPKEKMSKKARKELAAPKRATWTFSPVTKKIESKKLYNRNKKSHAGHDERTWHDAPGLGFCYIATSAFRRSPLTLKAPPLTLRPFQGGVWHGVHASPEFSCVCALAAACRAFRPAPIRRCNSQNTPIPNRQSPTLAMPGEPTVMGSTSPRNHSGAS